MLSPLLASRAHSSSSSSSSSSTSALECAWVNDSSVAVCVSRSLAGSAQAHAQAPASCSSLVPVSRLHHVPSSCRLSVKLPHEDDIQVTRDSAPLSVPFPKLGDGSGPRPSPSCRISVANTPREQLDGDADKPSYHRHGVNNNSNNNNPLYEPLLVGCSPSPLRALAFRPRSPCRSRVLSSSHGCLLVSLPLDVMTSIYDFLTLHDMMQVLHSNQQTRKAYHGDELWTWRCHRDWEWKQEHQQQMHDDVSHMPSSSSCHWYNMYHYLYNDFLSPVTSLISRPYSWTAMTSSTKSQQHVDMILQPSDQTMFILSNGPESMRRQWITKQHITQQQAAVTSVIHDLPISIILWLCGISLHIAFPMWVDFSDYIYFDITILSINTLTWFIPLLCFLIICPLVTAPRQPVSHLEPERITWHLIQHVTTTSANQLMYGYTLVVVVMCWFWLFNVLFEWFGALSCLLSLFYFLYRMTRSYRAGNLHVIRSILVCICHGALLCMFWFIDVMMIITKYILSPIFHAIMAWQLKPHMEHDWNKHGVLAASLLILGLIYVIDCRMSRTMLWNPAIRSVSLRRLIWRALITRIQTHTQTQTQTPTQTQTQQPQQPNQPQQQEHDQEQEQEQEQEQDEEEHLEQEQEEQQQSPSTPGFGFLAPSLVTVVVLAAPVSAPVPPSASPSPVAMTVRPSVRPPPVGVGVTQLGAYLEELGGMLLDVLLPRNMSMSWNMVFDTLEPVVWYGLMTGLLICHGLFTAAVGALVCAVVPCVCTHVVDVAVSWLRGPAWEARQAKLQALRVYGTDIRPFIPLSQQ